MISQLKRCFGIKIPKVVYLLQFTKIIKILTLQQQGQIEIYFSKTYFRYSNVNLSNCAVSWQIGSPFETCADSNVGQSVVLATSSSASPGYYKSFFPLTINNQFNNWPSDPSASATIDPISLELRNYYIKGTTINSDNSSVPTSKTTPSSFYIKSILQSSSNTHPGGKYFTFNPSSLSSSQYNDYAI